MNKEQIINSILSYEASYIGQLKKGTPSMQPIVDIYNTQKPLPRSCKATIDSAYCAIFQTACMIQAGIYYAFTPEMGVWELMKKEKDAGRFFTTTAKAQRGDLVFYKFDSYHIGMIEDITEGQITTIEGNWNDGTCGRRVMARAKSDTAYAAIIGYSRPNYDAYVTIDEGAETDKKYEIVKPIVFERGAKFALTQLHNGFAYGVCEGINVAIPSEYVSCDEAIQEYVPSKNPRWVGKANKTYTYVYKTQKESSDNVSTQYPRLGKGNLIDICDEGVGNWYYVRIAGKYFGWVLRSFIDHV